MLLHLGLNVITFRTLLHLGPNVITFRTLLHLGPNVITFRTLLHLGKLLHLGLQQPPCQPLPQCPPPVEAPVHTPQNAFQCNPH